MKILSKDATEEQKSSVLAELMGYKQQPNGTWTDSKGYWPNIAGEGYGRFVPYEDSILGLAQFAAITLKFPDVLFDIVQNKGSVYIPVHSGDEPIMFWKNAAKPTQADILDCILQMKGNME